jgi:hypothetical protein
MDGIESPKGSVNTVRMVTLYSSETSVPAHHYITNYNMYPHAVKMLNLKKL